MPISKNPRLDDVASRSIPALIFMAAFICLPFGQLNHLTMMPWDLGDSRLTNYFLENIYQFFTGHSSSLWNTDFFYPFPLVGAFSENLFGAAPAYLVPRFLGVQPDTAFQIWFLCGYLANYAAAYYALRRLGLGRFGALTGALVFTFALPTTSYAAPHLSAVS